MPADLTVWSECRAIGKLQCTCGIITEHASKDRWLLG